MSRYYDRASYSSGGLAFGPGAWSPFIRAMILVNVAVFVAQYFYTPLTELLGLTPAQFLHEFPARIYQIVTYMFLHGGIGHIFFNMLTLWMFGTEIERSWGSRRFAWFYTLAGISGALLTLLVKPGQIYPMIGASGAIYGVLVAYWVMFPQRTLYIYFLFPVKVMWAIPSLMLLGFLFGGTHVAHFAHLGGALFGLLYVKVDWRWAYLGRQLKGLHYRRQSAKLNRNRQKAEEVMQRVDALLDKINQVGLDGLSREERKFLEDASSHLSEKKPNE